MWQSLVLKKEKKGGLQWNSCCFPHPEAIAQDFLSDLDLSIVQLFFDDDLFHSMSLKFEELLASDKINDLFTNW